MPSLKPEAQAIVQDNLRFLLLTQNIGSLECSPGPVTDDIKTRTRMLLQSMAHFLSGSSVVLATEGGQQLPPHMMSAAAAQGKRYHPVTEADKDGSEPTAPAVYGQLTHDVVVIHFQEIGGKKYNESFNEFLGSEIRSIWPQAGWCSGLLMQPVNCDQTFTAMGTVVFLSKRLVPVTSILSVRQKSFLAVSDESSSGIGSPVHFFHGCKFSDAETSRKGFLLTALRIGNVTVNFINLHLYHDADNRVAVSSSPSEYVSRRLKAFTEAMEEVAPVLHPDDPTFIFGDVNTRLDGKRLVEYMQSTLGVTVVPGKKSVEAPPAFWEYIDDEKNVPALQRMDLELLNMLNAAATSSLKMELAEFPILFPPTYVKRDDAAAYKPQPRDAAEVSAEALRLSVQRVKRQFKTERLPAWCDRIVLNPAAMALVGGALSLEAASRRVGKQYVYNSTTLNATDHDAVYLAF